MNKGWLHITKSFLLWRAKHLSLRASRVLDILLFYLNGQTGNAWPSYPTIKEHTGMSHKSISLAVHELQDKQVIKSWLKPTGGKQFSSYTHKILLWDGHKISPPKEDRVTESELNSMIEDYLNDRTGN